MGKSIFSRKKNIWNYNIFVKLIFLTCNSNHIICLFHNFQHLLIAKKIKSQFIILLFKGSTILTGVFELFLLFCPVALKSILWLDWMVFKFVIHNVHLCTTNIVSNRYMCSKINRIELWFCHILYPTVN